MNVQTSKPLSVAVATRSDLMRRSLTAFLQANPELNVTALSNDVTSILTYSHQNRPDVLILDAALSDEVLPMLIEQLHTKHPALNCVVLVDTVQQQKSSLQAGANHALLKGFLDDQLTRAVLGMEKRKL